MTASAEASTPVVASKAVDQTAFAILWAISASHLLNDLIQSLIPAIYPILKDEFRLDYSAIGIITLTWQMMASILQPVVGIYTDRYPKPFSLAVGMGSTLLGLLILAYATTYWMILVGVSFVGIGSSIFHPESSRVARMASGGRHGLAQSVFQVGGNVGTAIGPLLALAIVVPNGQRAIAWFGLAALAGMIILTRVGFWYRARRRAAGTKPQRVAVSPVSRQVLVRTMLVLGALVFSKYIYMTSLHSYYTFYLIETFQLDVGQSQLMLFVFLGAVAAGTIAGGPLGDRFGRRAVIWFSILGVLPFTLALPFANLLWTGILTVPIGFILASAFPAIVVYAQELVPGKVGTVAGLFFGFAFGLGGIGGAALGALADHTSIRFVYEVCSVLPMLGILAVLLPDVRTPKPAA